MRQRPTAGYFKQQEEGDRDHLQRGTERKPPHALVCADRGAIRTGARVRAAQAQLRTHYPMRALHQAESRQRPVGVQHGSHRCADPGRHSLCVLQQHPKPVPPCADQPPRPRPDLHLIQQHRRSRHHGGAPFGPGCVWEGHDGPMEGPRRGYQGVPVLPERHDRTGGDRNVPRVLDRGVYHELPRLALPGAHVWRGYVALATGHGICAGRRPVPLLAWPRATGTVQRAPPPHPIGRRQSHAVPPKHFPAHLPPRPPQPQHLHQVLRRDGQRVCQGGRLRPVQAGVGQPAGRAHVVAMACTRGAHGRCVRLAFRHL
mmetsp:Transcript_23257/g.58166  ORF Transcript_23257/g.58166 Transcript_23257/m.58166 type:complete len:315 (-) Transcript_23257:164-1108(-)